MVTAKELWNDFAQEKQSDLREKLILQYTPLVRYVIERLAINFPVVLDNDDVYNCGVIGLIHAVDRFDPMRGVKFETYAISRIKGSIIDELRNLDPVPRSTRKLSKQIEQAYAELHEELNRPATEAEVAARLGIDVETLSALSVQLACTTISLDSAFDSDDGGDSVPIAETIEDKTSPNPAQWLERRELAQQLADILGQLPERERLVLALYYYEELTLREISKVMEVSESRVCQLHTQAIMRLRALLKGIPIKGARKR
jgi:RNA polymerase sigma factor for flagellar operon FliA